MNTKSIILVADDEEDLREILVDDVKSLGFDVLEASSGTQALEILRQNGKNIDAVMSDINMPGLNGLQLLETIRKEGIEVPFMFLTGYGDKEKVVTALRLGAIDFFEKPYERTKLLAALEKAAEFGRSLRSFQAELDEICKKANVPADQLAEFRKAQRELLLLKKANTQNKKSA